MGKYQKVSKYFLGCLINFLLLSTSLSKTQIVKNSHILAGNYFTFLNKCPEPNLKVFPYRIGTSVKRSEKYLSSETKFSTFLQLTCPNFSWNCVQDFIVIILVREIKFERVWSELEARKLFPETIMDKILDKTLVLMWNFSAVFCGYQQKFYFGRNTGH